MEWYRNDRVDDGLVPTDQCEKSSFPSQTRWKQYGLNTIDEGDIALDNPYAFGNCVADESDFSCEKLLDLDQLVELDCVVGEGDQTEISGLRGGISESSNCWNALSNNQDYQLTEFPWTSQTDENFMNSLLVNELHSGDQFHIYGSPYSQGTYTTSNSLTTDMLLDFHDVGSYEQMDSHMFTYAFDWDKELPGTSHTNLENKMISTAPQYSAPLENISQQVCTSRTIDDNPSVEETVLQEFGSAVQKMTSKSRLCFRDAMYRLATSSEKQSCVLQGDHGNISSEKPSKASLPDQTLRYMEKDATEPRTNTIDRTIADLLFNKPFQLGDYHQDINSAAKQYPPKQSHLTLKPTIIRGR